MRHIGSIPQQDDAERFGDHLLTLDVPNSVEEGSDGWAVWVERDDDLDRARAELDAFRRDPANAKYNGAARAAERIRTQQEKKLERLQKRYVDVRTRWGSAGQWAVPVTIGLIAVSLLAALGMRFNLSPRDLDPLERALLLTTWTPAPDAPAGFYSYEGLAGLRRGQVWRLITPIFIHYGPLHLIFNMFWLRDLGGMIEARRGSLFLALLVLAAAVIPVLGEYGWQRATDPAGRVAFGGMSGVVYALFGYVWIKGRFEPHQGLGLSQQTVWIMLAWLVLCMTGLVGPVANAAHVVGLLVGAAAAYAPIAWRRMRRSVR